MTASTSGRGAAVPRWARGLLAGAALAVLSTGMAGCGLSYAFKNISPLRPTGWSMPYPVFAADQQRLEEDIAREEYDRVPVLDPVPANSTAPACLDPPSEQDVWDKINRVKHGVPWLYEVQRNNVEILVEKIGEAVDPCKTYPLIGPAQKVSCHYKCTVYFNERYWSDYPVPFTHVDHRVEVVYIDKDFLRRCGGPPQVITPPIENTLNAPAVPGSGP